MQERGAGREVMVPMTSSLYVPGVIEDSTNVLVEVGAGYFIEKNTQDANGYCERKIKGLQESSSKVGQLIQGKKLQLQKVTEEYERRVKAMQDSMASQPQAAAAK